MTNSFLPPESQPWGREVEARLRALELQDSTTNAAINGLNATLSATQQAVRQVSQQQATLSAQQATLSAQQATLAAQQTTLSQNVAAIDVMRVRSVETSVATPRALSGSGWANVGGRIAAAWPADSTGVVITLNMATTMFVTVSATINTVPLTDARFTVTGLSGGTRTSAEDGLFTYDAEGLTPFTYALHGGATSVMSFSRGSETQFSAGLQLRPNGWTPGTTSTDNTFYLAATLLFY